MKLTPPWLPPILNTNGVWETVLSGLYQVFDSDFKNGKPKYKSMPVWYDRRVLPGDKFEEGFWHLITKKDWRSGDRLFDPRRAERLSWCCPILAKAGNDSIIKDWNYKEDNGTIRTYVWLEQFNFVVVLYQKEMRIGEVAFLVTAFHVDGDSNRQNLMKKYQKREA